MTIWTGGTSGFKRQIAGGGHVTENLFVLSWLVTAENKKLFPEEFQLPKLSSKLWRRHPICFF
ncbi:hypothetical protein [Hafnia alvei]|uniref:Uncharacterized protein n=1 Tax=Hafnia alvei TaxID=569 RepID=A0ABD7Q3R9_HAFAL|nr:hypothetical protein [Hafnia alvei]TBL64980.1 hypothetical protein EYY96_21790 [Hafnia alvei]